VLVTWSPAAPAASAAPSRSTWPRMAGTWRALPQRSADAEAETATTARALGARAEVLRRPTWPTRPPARPAAAVAQAFGRVDAVVNNASLFEYDERGQLRPRRDGAPLARQHRRAILLARRCTHGLGGHRDAPGCVVNLLDQKLWNPNPDYLSRTRCPRRRWRPPRTMLAQALAPRLRVCGVAPA
jgi:hypothetical protein